MHVVAVGSIKSHISLSRMSGREFYIKGYKLDRDKISKFPPWPNDPNNTRFLDLWKEFPEPFLYLENGLEPDGEINLVVVLADGYNKEEVEKTPIVELSEPYTEVFTAGVWVKDD